MRDLPEYALNNRAYWTAANAEFVGEHGVEAWTRNEITWGIWRTREHDVQALPEVRGRDVLELGCGTAYFSAWLKRMGADRVVGVDVTPAQLETARRLNHETGLGLELIEASAEAVPLPDAQFDLVLSEYGASIWCDPYKWIPEAARLLRPRGRLVFLCNSVLQMLCYSEQRDDTVETLQRPQFGLHRLDWGDPPSTEFHLGHGDWCRLLSRSEFAVEDLIEIYASKDAADHPYYSHVSADWARKWPAEEIWRARKL